MSTPSVSRVKKTGYDLLNIPIDPERKEIFNQLRGGSTKGVGDALSQISSLAGGGNEEQWRQLEAPALRQFGQLQGNIASRFSGMGSGARRSSGFQNVMGGAASDLAERLQGQRLSLQQGAQNQLMSLYQSLLGTPLSENALIPKKKPGWQTFFEGLGNVGGTLGGTFGGIGLGNWAFGD